jgi:hypothetical protein
MRWIVGALALLAGCSDALEQTSSAGQVIGVVNSTDRTLSLISASDFTLTTRSYAPAGAAPTTIAGRGHVFVVPLGPANAAAVDLVLPPCSTLCPKTDYVWSLSSGSGATGVAIQDDSIAWIANPNLNTVTRLNYLRGDTASVAVGPTPHALAIVGGVVFVVNANLSGSTPAGPSSISWLVLGAVPPSPLPTIPLTGLNAQFAVVGDDSVLYVVDRGTPGAGDGKLSIVDPKLRTEIAVLNGLGESPGAAVFHPSGRLLIASLTEGILEVYTPTKTLARGPGSGVKPEGDGVSGLAIDLRGHVYAVAPGGCVAAGAVHVLASPPDYGQIHRVTVGVCPASAAAAATP